MNNQLSGEEIASASKELQKLPLLGPAVWLFARDARLRYTFMADLDWRLLPPLVLDQCRLFSRNEIPWGFCTWALVNDAVNERLASQAPVIAPHEWRSGEHPWLIDVVAPFGDAEALAREAISSFAPGKTVQVWLPDAGGKPSLQRLTLGAPGG